jgi:hypothetical protein
MPPDQSKKNISVFLFFTLFLVVDLLNYCMFLPIGWRLQSLFSRVLPRLISRRPRLPFSPLASPRAPRPPSRRRGVLLLSRRAAARRPLRARAARRCSRAVLLPRGRRKKRRLLLRLQLPRPRRASACTAEREARPRCGCVRRAAGVRRLPEVPEVPELPRLLRQSGRSRWR